MNIFHVIVGAMLLVLSNSSFAAPLKNTPPLLPIDSDNIFFYEIGGGTNYRLSGGEETPDYVNIDDTDETFRLVLSVTDEFDPITSIESMLKNIFEDAKDKIISMVEDVVQTIIGGFGEYPLCRANPLSCQLHENKSVRAEEKMRFDETYIDAIQNDLAKARSNLDGWRQAGKAGFLVKAIKDAKDAGAAGKDEQLDDVADRVRAYSGKEGLQWIGGGYAGGDDQPPIRPVADVVKAGFNMLLGKGVMNTAKVAPLATNPDPILDYWDTPEEAAKWVTEVVGESRPDLNGKVDQETVGGKAQGDNDGDTKGGEDVAVDDGFLQTDKSTPAFGLAPKILKEKKLIIDNLVKLLKKDKATVKELTQLSGVSSNVVVTPRILYLIRNSPIKTALIKRISEEAAQANIISAALLAKRMLKAGRTEPYMSTYDIANKTIDTKIAVLDKEIEGVLFERKIAKEMVSSTLVGVITNSNNILLKDGGDTGKSMEPKFGEGGIPK